jgi:molecular chaperone DnaK
MVQELFGKEPHKGVNPDEVVAVGAAVQAGVLGGDVKDILLLDVTPLTLGIETLGGVFTKLIARNTTIPTRKSEIFSTAADGQTSVEVHVLQGEREMATHNKTLGRFHLGDIPPAPRGVPQIEVAFDIDANGIVNVSAKDLGTSKEQRITITASSGLAGDDVEQMVTDAEAHAAEDKQAREAADARNQADQLVYQVEKTLKENEAKIPQQDQAEVREALQHTKQALEKGDLETIKSATERLEKATHKIAEVIYRSQQAAGSDADPGAAGPGTSETQSSTSSDGDVIDAEVVDSSQSNS